MKRASVFCTAIVALLGVASALNAETIDGSMFNEDFNNFSQWTPVWVKNSGSASIADGKATLIAPNTQDGIIYGTPQGTLNFTASPSDWWLETSFKVVTATENDGKPLSSYRQWVLLSGSNTAATPPAPLTYVSGFDLRAITGDSGTTYQLGWYGWDNTTSGGSDRVPVVIGTGVNLTKEQFHNVKLHRKSDGNVDIYLDDVKIDTKALIGAANPNVIWMGDYSSTGVTGNVVYDFVRIGAPVPVPEPSTLAMLAAGLVGLLAYAWRKRK